MRIVCLSFLYYDYTIQLANSLSKKWQVMLIFPNRIPKEYLSIINESVDLYLFGYPKHVYQLLSIFTVYKIVKQIVKQVNIFKPDVVHFQVVNPLLSLLIFLLKKYPLVATFHDVKPHVGRESLMTEFVFCCARRYSDQIIVHGEKLKEIMIREYNISEEKMHTISIGEHEVAPFKKYEKKGLKEDKNLILFFGRIWEYKGLVYLIKAEPMITKEVPDAKIIIAGKGENFKKYEKMMANKNNFIICNYYIDYEKGAELFQRSSVVVLPYLNASQSGVIPTAYGFKKPVVATAVGAIPEIVDEGITGFIVPPRDPKALADAIVKLLKDDELRKVMGENAYKKLKNDLSWHEIAKKTIQVYEKAIVSHKKVII